VTAVGAMLAPARRARVALVVTARGFLAVDAHGEFGGWPVKRVYRVSPASPLGPHAGRAELRLRQVSCGHLPPSRRRSALRADAFGNKASAVPGVPHWLGGGGGGAGVAGIQTH